MIIKKRLRLFTIRHRKKALFTGLVCYIIAFNLPFDKQKPQAAEAYKIGFKYGNIRNVESRNNNDIFSGFYSPQLCNKKAGAFSSKYSFEEGEANAR